MINNIIDGICVMLNSEFGNTYEIYTESIEQGLHEPCFSILCVNPSSKKVLGNRYSMTCPVCIHYFPSTSDKNSECNNVLERLTDVLEFISVGDDLVRGTDLHGEVVGGVLNFFVTYNMYVYKSKGSEPNMEQIGYSANVKE